MAGSFPTLASGSVAKFPTTRAVGFDTEVERFLNDKEQRYANRRALVAFDLVFSSLSAADVATLRTFFETQKGQLDSTWTLAFDGTTYSNMVFIHDDFTATEMKPKRWSVRLRCVQVEAA